MATYTGVADGNGDFVIPFSSNYTSGQKVTVTAEKDAAAKTIEIFAPSQVQSAMIAFSGDSQNFPSNIGDVTININGAIGSDAMRSHSSNSSIWRRVTGLTISEGVTSIGSYAFVDWAQSKFLLLPQSLTSLGNNAFQGWGNALSLVIPEGISNIPAACFSGWSSASSLDLPSSIQTIAGNAFQLWSSCLEIIVRATTPPSIVSTSFQSLNAACIFKVPSGSVAAYQSAPNWSAYAARIQAI